MKIAILAHLNHHAAAGDMGTKNVAFHITRELRRRHQVISLEVKNPGSCRQIRAFRPDILHAVLAPSTPGFLVARFFSLAHRRAKLLISAPNPSYLPLKTMIRLCKPDLLLAQATPSEELFKALGIRTEFLPNGVDIDRFIPRDRGELRRQYGIDPARFVILHVGPVIPGRNLQILRGLQNDRNQIIIVGRHPVDREIYDDLKTRGFSIYLEYLEKIEELYALADAYVFPTTDPRSCIETPLSVLEAMSCNLPVISTPFGALPRLFPEGEGLFFVRQAADFINAVDIIKKGAVPVKTRQKVLPLSWDKIVRKLEKIYENEK